MLDKTHDDVVVRRYVSNVPLVPRDNNHGNNDDAIPDRWPVENVRGHPERYQRCVSNKWLSENIWSVVRIVSESVSAVNLLVLLQYYYHYYYLCRFIPLAVQTWTLNGTGFARTTLCRYRFRFRTPFRVVPPRTIANNSSVVVFWFQDLEREFVHQSVDSSGRRSRFVTILHRD